MSSVSSSRSHWGLFLVPLKAVCPRRGAVPFFFSLSHPLPASIQSPRCMCPESSEATQSPFSRCVTGVSGTFRMTCVAAVYFSVFPPKYGDHRAAPPTRNLLVATAATAASARQKSEFLKPQNSVPQPTPGNLAKSQVRPLLKQLICLSCPRSMLLPLSGAQSGGHPWGPPW